MATINDDGVGRTLTGTDGDDVINGNGGNDTIIGLRGRDELFGGSGSDTFDYRQGVFSETATGEIIDGGTDVGTVDRILVDGLVSFIDVDIRSIEEIEFRDGTEFTAHRASFLASELVANGGIAQNALIDASATDTNEIRVTMGAETFLNIAGLQFQDWDSSRDTFRITGDGASETIVLTNVKDTVSMGSGSDRILNILGNDQVTAGADGDTLSVSGTLAGALLDGGTGNDQFIITGVTDLRSANILSMETMSFEGQAAQPPQSVRFLSSQFSSTRVSNSLTVNGVGDADDQIFVNAVFSQRTIDASGWIFNTSGLEKPRVVLTGTSLDDTITGSAAADTITGGGLNDTIKGGGGADFIDAGTGDDTIVYDASDGLAPFEAGETLRGGTGFDTLRLNALTGTVADFRGFAEVSSIEKIDIAGGVATVMINSSQIGSAFASNLQFTNSGGSLAKFLQIHMTTATLDLSGLTLSGTDGDPVTVFGFGFGGNTTITGTAGNDFISGNNFSSVFNGFGGKDSISGGNLNDTFVFNHFITRGSTYAGGGDIDKMVFKAATTYDFRGSSLSSIERFSLEAGNGASASLVFDASQFPTVLEINSDTGSYNINVGPGGAGPVDRDFRFVSFLNWGADDRFNVTGSDADDTLSGSFNTSTSLRGEDGADLLTGGTQADTLNGGRGVDGLSGLAGDDTFILNSSDFIAGEVINGGSDFDTIGTASGLYDFRSGQLISIERLDADNFASNWRLNASQIGAGLSAAAAIQGGAGTQAQILDVRVDAGAVDLSGFTFDPDWDAGILATDDRVLITGSAAVDTIVGSIVDDTIVGGDGADVLRGGLGADQLSGAAGSDTFHYASILEFGDDLTFFSSVDFFSFASAAVGGLSTGTLTATRFVSRAVDNFAQDGNDLFIYRQSDDTLWFDADGSGAGTALLVADIANDFAMTASDILIV